MHSATFLPADTSIRKVAETMAGKNIGSVLIGASGDISGILTERDIIKKVTSMGLDPDSTKASDIANSPVVNIDADADVYQITSIFNENSIRRLPVMEEGQIIGILTTRDVTKSLIPGFFRHHPLFKDIKEYKKKG
ncbi:cyclic nucleotide-binding/CBS domain-containing protein [Candidatus Altiarchaeota archaeon]